MAKLIPFYLMPGTYVTVRMFDGTYIHRFKVLGKSDGTYRAIGFDMPLNCDIGDIRRWLGGRRLKGHKWECNPEFPKRLPDVKPVVTERGTWHPVGYLTTPREAKRLGGRPINEHTPNMLSPAALDVVQILEQQERMKKAPAERTHNEGHHATTNNKESDSYYGNP
ncbi:hypothetical protein [Corynebacterium confusum]|uniref:hypothetical protein n=1 Tax=Corynebacterium confusum TaxID=71254 RepID=UPI0025B34F46|nr:hypothetical protein [Corynebacterium confusum]WJY90492.1 hypothetical protein CCONF_09985 [Corynebacterium confusum]